MINELRGSRWKCNQQWRPLIEGSSSPAQILDFRLEILDSMVHINDDE